MSRWFARVDDLLYDGETVESRVDVGEGGVVVTSHRVLAFTPEADGANYRYVDRPNVGGVERTARGNATVLAPAIKAFVVGGFLLAGGQVVSLDGLVGSVDLSGAGATGLGGMLAMVQSLLGLLAVLDEAMTAGGALAVLAGALLVGGYLWTRRQLLVITVTGEDDLELPAADADDALVERLDRAVRPDAASETPERRDAADRDPLA